MFPHCAAPTFFGHPCAAGEPADDPPGPCRSMRPTLGLRKAGPTRRSPIARSTAHAVRGASGMVTISGGRLVPKRSACHARADTGHLFGAAKETAPRDQIATRISRRVGVPTWAELSRVRIVCGRLAAPPNLVDLQFLGTTSKTCGWGVHLRSASAASRWGAAARQQNPAARRLAQSRGPDQPALPPVLASMCMRASIYT